MNTDTPTPCPDCGALIANQQTHTSWHQWLRSIETWWEAELDNRRDRAERDNAWGTPAKRE